MKRTIHHQHDIGGGLLFGLLLSFRGFSLVFLGAIAWLGFLAVQDWFSGTTMKPDQYEIELSVGTGEFTAVEQARIEQTIRIVNRSDIALTEVNLRQKVFMCPPGYSRIGDCTKVVDKPEILHADLAPDEGKTLDIGSTIYPFGSKGNESFIVKTQLIEVKGDKDREA